MQLGITIPLQRFLCRRRPEYGEVDDFFFCWEAHRVVLDGTDVLLLANASNRFAALSCLQPGDWRVWEDVALKSVRRALLASGFDGRAADAYLFFAGAPEVTRTHGRRPVAFLNVLVDKLLAAPVRVDRSCVFQSALSRFANEQLPCKAASFEGLGVAVERFADDMARTMPLGRNL